MNSYEFSWVVEGLDLADNTLMEQLYRLYDGVVAHSTAGLVTVTLLVDAPTAEDALMTSLDTFRRHLPEVTVLRMDHDLVDIDEIAYRIGRHSFQVRDLLTNPDTTVTPPTPETVLATGQPLWRWSEIVEWLQDLDADSDDTNFSDLHATTPIDRHTATLFDAHLTHGMHLTLWDDPQPGGIED